MTQNTRPDLSRPETKEAYIAAHWRQEVMYGSSQKEPYTNTLHVLEHLCRASNADYKVLLTDLSHITDEDALAVLKIFGSYSSCLNYQFVTKANSWEETFRQVYTDDISKDGGCQGIDAITVHANFSITGLHSLHSNRDTVYWTALDYLRSKGYALPWNGYTVKELIEAGYCQLKGGERE